MGASDKRQYSTYLQHYPRRVDCLDYSARLPVPRFRFLSSIFARHCSLVSPSYLYLNVSSSSSRPFEGLPLHVVVNRHTSNLSLVLSRRPRIFGPSLVPAQSHKVVVDAYTYQHSLVPWDHIPRPRLLQIGWSWQFHSCTRPATHHKPPFTPSQIRSALLRGLC